MSGVSHRYHRRADTVAIGVSHQTIVEGIRPMVKGTIAQDAFVNNMHWECDMMREYPLGLRILRCVGRACGIEGCCALRGLSLCAWYRSMDPPSHHRHRRLHRHHRHRGDNVNEILAVTDGVVEAVRDAGWYASAAFAGARSMLAECGMRRLEAEGESVQRERTFLKLWGTTASPAHALRVVVVALVVEGAAEVKKSNTAPQSPPRTLPLSSPSSLPPPPPPPRILPLPSPPADSSLSDRPTPPAPHRCDCSYLFKNAQKRTPPQKKQSILERSQIHRQRHRTGR